MPYSPKSNREKRLLKIKAKTNRRKYDKKYEGKRRADPLLELARKIRSSKRWKEIRIVALRRDKYLCVDPFGYHEDDNRVEPALDVNHIFRLRERPDLCFELSNLASLCRDCHNRITRLERLSRPVAYLFMKKSANEPPRGLWQSDK